MQPSPSDWWLGLQDYHFRGHLCVRSRYGLIARRHPKVTLSMGFTASVSLCYAILATELLAVALAGLSPAECTRLIWTHNRT